MYLVIYYREGWISIWNQEGIEVQKIWNLGIEAQNIWELRKYLESRIWGFWEFCLDRIICSAVIWATNRDRAAQDPCHFRADIRFQKVFSNGLKWNPMELCDYVTHWIIIFISDLSLTHLDLIIWFSLYLIKVACFETGPPPPPEQVLVLCQSVIIIKIYLNANFPYCQLFACFCQWNINITCI